MLFREYLEVFDTVHRLSDPYVGAYRYSRSFDIGDWRYNMDANLEDMDEGHWSITFSVDSGDEGDPYGFGAMKQLSADRSRVAPSPMKVFAGVRQFIDSFIRDKSPGSFEFSAVKSEPSRVSLYNRLAPQMARVYGYNFRIEDEGYEVKYLFEKKQFTA